MKKCRFCAEAIQDEAIKCRYCGEFLDESYRPKAKQKWYLTTPAIVTGLLGLGPFALPLVWMNPKYKVITKIVVTVVVIAVTIWLCQVMGEMYQRVIKQVTDLGMHSGLPNSQ